MKKSRYTEEQIAFVVKQRTQLGNALRGYLAEYGWVAPQGSAHLPMLGPAGGR